MGADLQPLTLRQREVLLYVQHRMDADGLPPTLREVCEHFGWRSSVAAADHFAALHRKGWLDLGSTAKRGSRVLRVLYRAVPLFVESREGGRSLAVPA